MQVRILTLAALALAAAGNAHAVNLDAAGYTQSFDALGTTGTAVPAGWRLLVGESGTSNTTWSANTGIKVAGSTGSVASMVASSGKLTAATTPSGTNNNGFNAALNASSTSDRVLATSPTTVSGAALELSLTNATSASFSSLMVSYDTVRFTSVSSANELPGYELFYSIAGGAWTNVSALNPTTATVPNSIGVTSVSDALITLNAPVAVGQTITLRWVDDNAVQTSPDQIIGLNNVRVSAVPEPASMALLLGGLLAVGVVVRRRSR